MSEPNPDLPRVEHISNDMFDKSPEEMDDGERVQAALDVASSYGGIDGDHHKAWIIDQMVRVLTGSPFEVSAIHSGADGRRFTHEKLGESEEYRDFVKQYEEGEDGPYTFDWDTGIAP